MTGPQSVTTSEHPPGPDQRRRAVHRSLLLRGLAVVVLIVFVLAVGDYRRKHNGIDQAERYAAALRNRIGDSESLPLNLAPDSFEELRPSGVSLDALSREEVQILRDRSDRILIAWSVRLLQVLNRNGRAVIYFDQGRITPQWVSEKEFQVRKAAQRAMLNASRDLP
jgi:hypothetical protein